MQSSLLVIVNGLPGSGKTTLAHRLAQDLRLPVFSRDKLYETLSDTLSPDAALQPLVGAASFRLLYQTAGELLAVGQPLIVEGFFGRPDLRTAEFLDLQRRQSFEPFQILCKAEGALLVERFLARAGSGGRHPAHTDLDWLEQNRDRLLRGSLPPLALAGQLVEIDTTTPETLAYDALLQQLRATLA